MPRLSLEKELLNMWESQFSPQQIKKTEEKIQQELKKDKKIQKVVDNFPIKEYNKSIKRKGKVI